MKVFNILYSHAGTLLWQGVFQGEEMEGKQQSICLNFHTSSLTREGALSHLAETLMDQDETWLQPVGAPEGQWLVDLDVMLKKFPDQQWLTGKRLIVPAFDLFESTTVNRSRRSGVVRFTLHRRQQGHGATALALPAPQDLHGFLGAFRRDYPDASRCGFLMMSFSTSRLHTEIARVVRATCKDLGLSVLMANDRRYADDLLPNIRTYMHGCSFGVAVFERLESEIFNPNVSLEVGYMMALGKPVCLLKDSTLRGLQSDLVGRLYEGSSVQDVEGTLPSSLGRWLDAKGIASFAAAEFEAAEKGAQSGGCE